MAEDMTFLPKAEILTLEELERLSAAFIATGVDKIRLTGGEPLVRKDAADIIERLSKLPVKLTITTNGTRLHEFVDVIKKAGITSLNISLDTLQKDRFMLMTRRDQFDRVRSNIDLMLSEGINVRVNSVVMKGLNDHEISDFVAWTKEQPVHIRFIEFMPFSGNRWDSSKVMTWQEILSRVSDEYDVLPLDREKHDTAKKYIVPGHQGTFAVISTMSAPFCGDCNRMRLTADGKMKNCLFSTSETDLLTAFRNGEDVVPLIHQSIRDKKKALGGQFTTDMGKIETSKLENRSMITIGG
jgi:cyclic pyranopterin phosphate synthase